MIWAFLIIVGAYGLFGAGNWSGLIFIVGGALGLWHKYMRNNGKDRHDEETSNQIDQVERVVEIPDDAHDAVEVFAKLVNKTYAILDQAYTRDKYFYKVSIDLKFGEDDSSSHAEFSFNFDWNMEGFFEAYGYSLGKGFFVDGEDVCYKSDRVQGLYSWLGAEKMERKRTGGAFNAHFAMALTDGIVATFVNNCPSAYVIHKGPMENGFAVIFKFK